MSNNITFFVAVGGGLLSFLSPCVLPLIPAYLGSLAGPEILEPKIRKFHLPLFLHSLAFVAGLTLVFVALGALVGWAGFSFASQQITRRIAGIMLIVFGLYMLLAIKIPWLNYERRFNAARTGRIGYLRSFVIGLIFAFAWTPCAGPILGGILALALNTNTVLQGILLLLCYSLGVAVPFLALGIAFDFLLPLLKQIRKYSVVIYLVSGALLIFTGILTLSKVWF
ncbi:MAG: cytochrome c biogenesis protein CcdA [Dehalococcoidales bacterium]|nr:cytochrome c biogenesis protein CcdA [Dehalococcoidales bacterium]